MLSCEFAFHIWGSTGRTRRRKTVWFRTTSETEGKIIALAQLGFLFHYHRGAAMRLGFCLRPAVWLDDFIPAGMAHGAWREFHVEGDVLRHQRFL